VFNGLHDFYGEVTALAWKITSVLLMPLLVGLCVLVYEGIAAAQAEYQHSNPVRQPG